MDEKKTLALNIKRILQRFGGAWLTPDLTTLEDSHKWHENFPSKKPIEKFLKAITKMTGRDFKDREFADQADPETFFAKLGFQMEVSSQLDGSYELSSLKYYAMPADALERMRANLRMWTLTLDGNQ